MESKTEWRGGQSGEGLLRKVCPALSANFDRRTRRTDLMFGTPKPAGVPIVAGCFLSDVLYLVKISSKKTRATSPTEAGGRTAQL